MNQPTTPCTRDDLRVAVATTCYLDEDGTPGDFLDERDIWVDTNPNMTDGAYWCDGCNEYFRKPEEALAHVGIRGKVAV